MPEITKQQDLTLRNSQESTIDVAQSQQSSEKSRISSKMLSVEMSGKFLTKPTPFHAVIHIDFANIAKITQEALQNYLNSLKSQDLENFTNAFLELKSKTALADYTAEIDKHGLLTLTPFDNLNQVKAFIDAVLHNERKNSRLIGVMQSIIDCTELKNYFSIAQSRLNANSPFRTLAVKKPALSESLFNAKGVPRTTGQSPLTPTISVKNSENQKQVNAESKTGLKPQLVSPGATGRQTSPTSAGLVSGQAPEQSTAIVSKDEGVPQYPLNQLLACLANKIRNSQRQSDRIDQIKKSSISDFFNIDRGELHWNPNHKPKTKEDINQIVNFFLNSFSSNTNGFVTNLFELCVQYFPDLSATDQFKQNEKTRVIDHVAKNATLDIFNSGLRKTFTKSQPQVVEDFTRSILLFYSDGKTDSDYDPAPLSALVRESLCLEQIGKDSTKESSHLSRLEIPPIRSGMIDRIRHFFNRSTNTQIVDYQDRFLDFHNELLNTFKESLGSLGKNRQHNAIPKIKSHARASIVKAEKEFENLKYNVPNPFGSEISEDKFKQIDNEISKTVNKELANSILESICEFENAYISALDNSLNEFDVDKVLSGKKDTAYREYIARWNDSFIRLSNDLSNLHNNIETEVLYRVHEIGGDVEFIKLQLQLSHKQAKEKLDQLILSVALNQSDKLLKKYLENITALSGRSSQKVGQTIVRLTKLYWSETAKSYDDLNRQGLDAGKVISAKINALKEFKESVISVHVEKTKSKKSLWGRMRDSVSHRNTKIAAGLVAGGSVLGLLMALAPPLVIPAIGAAAGVALICGAGYFGYVAVSTVLKHLNIKNQRLEIKRYCNEMLAGLDTEKKALNI